MFSMIGQSLNFKNHIIDTGIVGIKWFFQKKNSCLEKYDQKFNNHKNL